jgi:5-methylcytosine-specific restriction enzyme A
MQRPLVYCTQPGCPARVVRGRCPAHALPPRQETDRPDVDVRRWYRLERWTRLRRGVLVAAAYTCATCGVVTPRLEIDHVVKHGGDPVRFWDRSNLQALCPQCHQRKTMRGE